MLVRNNCVRDNRVLKEAEALSDEGFDVNVLALLDETTTEYTVKNGVKFHRVSKSSVLLQRIRNNYQSTIQGVVGRYKSKVEHTKTRYLTDVNNLKEKYILNNTQSREVYINRINRLKFTYQQLKEQMQFKNGELIKNYKQTSQELSRLFYEQSGKRKKLVTKYKLDKKLEKYQLKLILKFRSVRLKTMMLIYFIVFKKYFNVKLKILQKMNKVLFLVKHKNKRMQYKMLSSFRTKKYMITRNIAKKVLDKKIETILMFKPLYGLYDFHVNSKRKLSEINADVYHAHDLNTLLTAYLISKKTGAKLVYDSHELEIHRNRIKESFFEKWVWRILERILIKRCDGIITVSEGIAEFLEDYYKINRPIILLNSPKYYVPTDSMILRNKYKEKRIILYVGGITFNRGLEQTIEAMKYVNEEAIFIAIGPKNINTSSVLEKMITDLDMKNRVYLLEPVAVDEIKLITSSADIGIIPALNVCLGHDLSLPSKFFEYAFAELPVAVGNLKELGQLVNKYQIGVSFNQTDPKDIAAKLNSLLEELPYYKENGNFTFIRDNMCWESEQKKLIELYKNMNRSLYEHKLQTESR
ncbi:glycosyltransferase [Brevibacillus panacihumi]|uniref:glycosyltransferase n=1 Tax=Brevibacillus panacihumi TaxID=497735 RepID=UPI003D048CAD